VATTRPTKPTKETRREQARARIAQQRQAQLRAERRRRIWLAAGIPVGVLAIVGILVLIAVTSGGKTSNGTTSFGAAPASVVSKLTSVPAADFDKVGVGSTQLDSTKKLTGAALTSGGKPRVLYAGAEYCPYCAFERWGMIVALSRFGTFTGIDLMKSSSGDIYPSTDTFTFAKATYTSNYIVFDPHELQDRNSKVIGTLDSADQALFTNVGSSSYPFIDVGGKWYQSTSGTSDAFNAVHGKTWQQIADSLTDPSSATAKAVLGTANQLTAEICSTMNNTPAAICDAPGVVAAAKALDSAS
jgi:Domain of unknown function (DUF929)